MSLATVCTRAQLGIDAPPVICEVQVAGGLPRLTIVGLVETAVKESRERVKAATRTWSCHASFKDPSSGAAGWRCFALPLEFRRLPNASKREVAT